MPGSAWFEKPKIAGKNLAIIAGYFVPETSGTSTLATYSFPGGGAYVDRVSEGVYDIKLGSESGFRRRYKSLVSCVASVSYASAVGVTVELVPDDGGTTYSVEHATDPKVRLRIVKNVDPGEAGSLLGTVCHADPQAAELDFSYVAVTDAQLNSMTSDLGAAWNAHCDSEAGAGGVGGSHLAADTTNTISATLPCTNVTQSKAVLAELSTADTGDLDAHVADTTSHAAADAGAAGYTITNRNPGDAAAAKATLAEIGPHIVAHIQKSMKHVASGQVYESASMRVDVIMVLEVM